MGRALANLWTSEQDSILRKRAYEPFEALAVVLGRSPRAVEARVHKLKLRSRVRNYRVVETIDDVAPPIYVLRERSIRSSIPPASNTAIIFGDPLPGYTAKDTKYRRLSVPDAIEICALYSGHPGEIIALSGMYGVGVGVIEAILNGSWFDKLLPRNMRGEHDFA